MSDTSKPRSKRCAFCKRKFTPHPRAGGAQYACSNPACQGQRQDVNVKLWRERAALAGAARTKPTSTRRRDEPSRGREHAIHRAAARKLESLQIVPMEVVAAGLRDIRARKSLPPHLALLIGLTAEVYDHLMRKSIAFGLDTCYQRGLRILSEVRTR